MQDKCLILSLNIGAFREKHNHLMNTVFVDEITMTLKILFLLNLLKVKIKVGSPSTVLSTQYVP